MKETDLFGVFAYNGFHMAMAPKQLETEESQETRFLKAYEEYSDALFRHASLRINSRERAIDIVHDTFTKVWGYVRNGHTVESFRPFLYKVLNNLIIDEYRKRKDVSLDALMEEDGVDEGSFPELSESSIETLAATIDGKKAFDLLERLPDQYREVIILRFVDELGPREIATLIEETENTVSVRIHRGLKLLRAHLESQDELASIKRRATKKHETLQ
jgi:RNA polymerase sigma-70 factor, ECF subfamily